MFVPIISTESELGNNGLDHTNLMELLKNALLGREIQGVGVMTVEGLRGLNGCRLYIDVHRGLEYAAGESRTPREAMVHEMAGPHLINWLYGLLMAKTATEPAWLMKNNTTPDATFTYGNHINVQMPLRKNRNFSDSLDDFAEVAAALTATLPLVCGAGVVIPKKDQAALGRLDYSYRISARSHFVGNVTGVASTSDADRPMFLKRNEPLGDKTQYWRLQVLSTDANILPAANILKLTILQLIAEMWAAGCLRPVMLADPVQTLRGTSTDWRSSHWLEDGGTATALTIQENYFQQAQEYIARFHGGRRMYRAGMEEWGRQLRAFRDTTEEVPGELFGHNDWVTKYAVLRQGGKPFWASQNRHLVYHGYQLGAKFHQSNPVRVVEKFADPQLAADIQRAMVTPAPTRARARSRFLGLIESQGWRGAAIQWDWVQFGNTKVCMPNPRNQHVPELETLLEFISPLAMAS